MTGSEGFVKLRAGGSRMIENFIWFIAGCGGIYLVYQLREIYLIVKWHKDFDERDKR